jgi:hypothetical protein
LAAGAGSIDLLEILLQHGADPNIPIGANSPLNEALLGILNIGMIIGQHNMTA